MKISNLLDDLGATSINENKKIPTKVKYISFDIFDTLIKRDVPKPTDVFKIIESNFMLDGFEQKRIHAENKARKETNKHEITINDIYSYIDYDKDLSCKLMNYEKKIEKRLCVKNLNIYDFYQEVKKKYKVILVTDMYLDRETIIAILDKNGINGYKKVYVSSELNKTKANGELFSYVLKDLNVNGKEVLHIGNSFRADCLGAMKNNIKCFKVSTHNKRMYREKSNILCKNDETKLFLNSFLNNHRNLTKSDYSSFGYEIFGPLIFGFVSWLYENLKKENFSEVLFMARDGYILKKVYDYLGYNEEINSFYFEASRRSLRVPAYYKDKMTIAEVLNSLPVPNVTTLQEIFDGFGLDLDDYTELLFQYNYKKDTRFKREALENDDNFMQLMHELFPRIIMNSKKECSNLKGYLSKFNFKSKVAIVDIGWGGSMQKYLQRLLSDFNVNTEVFGYYLGLTKKSRENLGKNNLQAWGYVFDCLNRNDKELERPFVGLFETLFLERDGSVKNYEYNFEMKGIYASRYPYEYKDKIEASCIREVQEGAVDFVRDYSESPISSFVNKKSKIYFSNLYEIGINPTLKDLKLFGNFHFFNNGEETMLASPKSIFYYLLNFKQLINDLFDSQWKVGFLKRLFKIKLPYLKMFRLLRKIVN